MIRKCVSARERGDGEVVLWGDGSPTREFLYVEDAAEAMILGCRALRLERAGQHRQRRRDLDPRPRDRDREGRPASRAASCGTRRSRTASRAAGSTSTRAQERFGFEAKTSFDRGPRGRPSRGTRSIEADEDMKRALITGITGQDGSYLAELLLGEGLRGLRRRPALELVQHRAARAHLPGSARAGLPAAARLRRSRRRQLARERSCGQIQPDEIYNLGAQSHVRVSFDVPEYTASTCRRSGTLRLLEAMRELGLDDGRFYQASSSEMFGARRRRRARRRRSSRAARTRARRCSRISSARTTARRTACSSRAASCSTTRPRAAGFRSSRARSRARRRASSTASTRSCTSATSTPSATGASPATTSRRCG